MLSETKRTIKAERDRWQRAARTIIAATRRDLDLTQEQLAERIGWTRDRVAKLESGKSDVKLPDFCVIAQRGFRMKPDDLFLRVVRW